MQITIYDKTDKGREEIATRKWHLPSRMRSLLVLIDGKKTDADIVQKIGGLGLNLQSLQELKDEDFIQRVYVESDEVDTQLVLNSNDLDLTVAPSKFDSDANTLSAIEALEPQTIFEPANEDEAVWNDNLDALLAKYDDDDNRQSRVDMMKAYLAPLIKENLGLRGFFLQRKLQKARSLEDIHAFRHPYIAAILHAKGKDKAVELRDEFDSRMYIRFSIDDPEFLEN